MVIIDSERCTGCGACVSDCVAGNLTLDGGKARCGGPCLLCGHCVAICPERAASVTDYDMAEVEERGERTPFPDPDSLLFAIKFRRSIRQFDAKKIERARLERLIEAGRYTATGSNRQACRFILVQDGLAAFREMIYTGIGNAKEAADPIAEKLLPALRSYVLLRARGTDFLFRDAPAVLYIAADSAVDAALAAQNIELAAVSEGLGVLYNGFLRAAAALNPAALGWLDMTDKPPQVCMLLGYPRVSYCRTAPRRAADVRWK